MSQSSYNEKEVSELSARIAALENLLGTASTGYQAPTYADFKSDTPTDILVARRMAARAAVIAAIGIASYDSATSYFDLSSAIGALSSPNETLLLSYADIIAPSSGNIVNDLGV